MSTNEQRPHEALGQATPAEFYEPSKRPYLSRLKLWESQFAPCALRARSSGRARCSTSVTRWRVSRLVLRKSRRISVLYTLARLGFIAFFYGQERKLYG